MSTHRRHNTVQDDGVNSTILCEYYLWVRWCNVRDVNGYYIYTGLKGKRFSFVHQQNARIVIYFHTHESTNDINYQSASNTPSHILSHPFFIAQQNTIHEDSEIDHVSHRLIESPKHTSSSTKSRIINDNVDGVGKPLSHFPFDTNTNTNPNSNPNHTNHTNPNDILPTQPQPQPTSDSTTNNNNSSGATTTNITPLASASTTPSSKLEDLKRRKSLTQTQSTHTHTLSGLSNASIFESFEEHWIIALDHDVLYYCKG